MVKVIDGITSVVIAVHGTGEERLLIGNYTFGAFVKGECLEEGTTWWGSGQGCVGGEGKDDLPRSCDLSNFTPTGSVNQGILLLFCDWVFSPLFPGKSPLYLVL